VYWHDCRFFRQKIPIEFLPAEFEILRELYLYQSAFSFFFLSLTGRTHPMFTCALWRCVASTVLIGTQTVLQLYGERYRQRPIGVMLIGKCAFHISGAVWKSRLPSRPLGPNKSDGFCGRKAALDFNCTPLHRDEELWEGRGGRPGLPVPNKPGCFCGCKATLKRKENNNNNNNNKTNKQKTNKEKIEIKINKIIDWRR